MVSTDITPKYILWLVRCQYVTTHEVEHIYRYLDHLPPVGRNITYNNQGMVVSVENKLPLTEFFGHPYRHDSE